jgi:hypothetical protein
MSLLKAMTLNEALIIPNFPDWPETGLNNFPIILSFPHFLSFTNRQRTLAGRQLVE